MKKSIKVVIAVSMMLLLVFGSGASSFAASVNPIYILGNNPFVSSSYEELKVDPPSTGTHDDGILEVDLTLSSDLKWID